MRVTLAREGLDLLGIYLFLQEESSAAAQRVTLREAGEGSGERSNAPLVAFQTPQNGFIFFIFLRLLMATV